jgi:hypothetical protein
MLIFLPFMTFWFPMDWPIATVDTQTRSMRSVNCQSLKSPTSLDKEGFIFTSGVLWHKCRLLSSWRSQATSQATSSFIDGMFPYSPSIYPRWKTHSMILSLHLRLDVFFMRHRCILLESGSNTHLFGAKRRVHSKLGGSRWTGSSTCTTSKRLQYRKKYGCLESWLTKLCWVW